MAEALFPCILSQSPSQDVSSPLTHLHCQILLQHSRNGSLQHLFATILKWNGKEGIALGHVKRIPEEMVHPITSHSLTVPMLVWPRYRRL